LIPIAGIEEMREIDRSSPCSTEVLIERAGAAVARSVLRELGGAYGRRVIVLAGKGSNGEDGRVAAKRLRRRGVRVQLIDADEAPEELPDVDLVIDAAYGTGLKRPYEAPSTNSTVLSVDIPSGVDGRTGCSIGRPFKAKKTLTFNALKPGHVFSDGACLSGELEVADIGLDTSSLSCGLVTDGDVSSWIPARSNESHKWKLACWVIAGSEGMEGAAILTVSAAQRAGAGYIRFSSPEVEIPDVPLEAVSFPVQTDLLIDENEISRFKSFVIGPGLGRNPELLNWIKELVSRLKCPVVLDGDALYAFDKNDFPKKSQIILTPHEGEFETIMGEKPALDRISAVRKCAEETGAVVLLKGPTTVVSDPEGNTRIINSGDQRLATAGSGDVLAGIIGAFLARGAGLLEAASSGAHVHGQLLKRLPSTGVVANDLVTRLIETLVDLGVDRELGVSDETDLG
jgi:NAD(P)H-hydrate epimerase